MPVHITNEDVNRLAREASKRSGLSMTQAIKQALEQFLEQMPHEQDSAEKLAEIDRIVAEFAPYVRNGATSDHDWLFDENGLPK